MEVVAKKGIFAPADYLFVNLGLQHPSLGNLRQCNPMLPPKILLVKLSKLRRRKNYAIPSARNRFTANFVNVI